MRIRRRDKDPAETAGPGEPEVVLYDYDEDGSGSSDEVTILPTEPILADPAPPSQPQTASSAAQAAHVRRGGVAQRDGARTDSPAGGDGRRVPR